MNLLKTECEVEVRAYSKQGILLNQKWFIKNIKEMQTVFPDIFSAGEVTESAWIETKRQADYLKVNFEDLENTSYEVFMYWS